MKLNLGLDLGSDSLKMVYAYTSPSGKIEYGKITSSDSTLRVAFPAVALLNDETGEWIYGDLVDRQYNASFIKVVKIKDLLSLLQKPGNTQFYDDHHFPKFFFPRNADAFENYHEAVRQGKTFQAKESPRKVCENFFRYAKTVLDRRIADLEERDGVTFDHKINISMVHPLKADKAYVDELARIVQVAFGTAPSKIMSTTKALGMFVKHTKNITENDNLLIFDMGEEDISVSKISIGEHMNLLVDGVEGHVSPLHVGGINIDYAIANYIETDIHERDTVGTPPPHSPQGGHVYEDALATKQYLFMKGIKKAKVILSRAFDEESIFNDGAPVGIYYEILIQRLLTQGEVAECIGTADSSGLAKQILEYIIAELQMPLNAGLTSSSEIASKNPAADHGYVILSGGLSDTFSLRAYIEQNIGRFSPDLSILSLDCEEGTHGEFCIPKNESAAYAAAAGGALVALYNEEIKTVLSFSYGTWVTVGNERCLDIFIDKGQILESQNAFNIHYNFSGRVDGERLYSTVITRRDIEAGSYRGKKLDIRLGNDGKRYLRIGEDDGDYRRSVQALFKLQTVAGDDNASIEAYYRGSPITHIFENMSARPTQIKVTQGINVDASGKIAPTYGIDRAEKGRTVRIRLLDGARTQLDSVPVTSIEIRGPQISAKAVQN